MKTSIEYLRCLPALASASSSPSLVFDHRTLTELSEDMAICNFLEHPSPRVVNPRVILDSKPGKRRIGDGAAAQLRDANMEDYGFEYSEEEPEEQDVDIEINITILKVWWRLIQRVHLLVLPK
ncbi:hypothetical protein L1887_08984 [Cichorium endivia]|nr:hypothetical protein L1887_08984 [Cichorium endivia]